MKKLLITCCAALTFASSQAQEKTHLIKMSIGVINKVRIGYERPLNEKFSVGGVVNAYYGIFPGIKVEPFARYYFGSECPSGLYSQVRFLYGRFNSAAEIDGLDKNTPVINATGGGLDLGYQWLSGKNKNIIVDISLGVQIMSGKVNSTSNSVVNAAFYTTGPGAIFNPHLSLGYAF